MVPCRHTWGTWSPTPYPTCRVEEHGTHCHCDASSWYMQAQMYVLVTCSTSLGCHRGAARAHSHPKCTCKVPCKHKGDLYTCGTPSRSHRGTRLAPGGLGISSRCHANAHGALSPLMCTLKVPQTRTWAPCWPWCSITAPCRHMGHLVACGTPSKGHAGAQGQLVTYHAPSGWHDGANMAPSHMCNTLTAPCRHTWGDCSAWVLESGHAPAHEHFRCMRRTLRVPCKRT